MDNSSQTMLLEGRNEFSVRNLYHQDGFEYIGREETISETFIYFSKSVIFSLIKKGKFCRD